MGHNRAGETRKRRLKAAKKEQQRLWCGVKPDPNPVAKVNFPGTPGGTYFISIDKIRMSERVKTKLFINPRAKLKKGRLQPAMRKVLRREIRESGCAPIDVRRDGDGYLLIAGERRLLACKQLGYKRIPVRIMDVADDREACPAGDSLLARRLREIGQGGDFINRRFEKLE